MKFESKTCQKSKLCFNSKLENSVGLNKNEKPFCFIGCVECDKIDRLPNGFNLEKKTNLYAQLCKKNYCGFYNRYDFFKCHEQEIYNKK